jgi:hypothetical protein
MLFFLTAEQGVGQTRDSSVGPSAASMQVIDHSESTDRDKGSLPNFAQGRDAHGAV